jgi:putative Holliday junction resolvase
MKLLGIDYGERKVGVALAISALAEPLTVIHYSEESELLAKIKRIVEEEGIEKVIIGVSEGSSEESSRQFGVRLASYLQIAIEYEDETLSTEDVQRLTIEAGIKRKKRRKLEDAYAATVILQNYIDR